MSPLVVRVVCGVLAVVLLAIIVIRRKHREQQGHEN